MNIDADTHYTPREVLEGLPAELKDLPQIVRDEKGNERLWLPQPQKHHSWREQNYSLKMRIDAMKEAGFDKQCLLVANGTIPEPFMSLKSTVFLVRRWNDCVAKVCEKNDCFIGVAQIPHSDPGAAIEEARRAVRDLGFRAVQFKGSWAGKNVESPEWWPFFEAIEKLGVPIWYHGVGNVAYRVLNPDMPAAKELKMLPPPTAVFEGFLWQAQLIVTGLIYSGIIDKYPNLKVALTEVDASWVPHFMGFLDELANAHAMYKQSGIIETWNFGSPYMDMKLRKKPSQRIRENFLFAITNPSEMEIETMLPVLVNRLGLVKNLMIESDYDHPEGTLDIVRRVRRLRDISEEAKDMVCGKNAADALKLEWAPSAYVTA